MNFFRFVPFGLFRGRLLLEESDITTENQSRSLLPIDCKALGGQSLAGGVAGIAPIGLLYNLLSKTSLKFFSLSSVYK